MSNYKTKRFYREGVVESPEDCPFLHQAEGHRDVDLCVCGWKGSPVKKCPQTGSYVFPEECPLEEREDSGIPVGCKVY